MTNPTPHYGNEAWVLREERKRRIETAEKRFLRPLLYTYISLKNKKTIRNSTNGGRDTRLPKEMSQACRKDAS
jgi:hypothetical protein